MLGCSPAQGPWCPPAYPVCDARGARFFPSPQAPKCPVRTWMVFITRPAVNMPKPESRMGTTIWHVIEKTVSGKTPWGDRVSSQLKPLSFLPWKRNSRFSWVTTMIRLPTTFAGARPPRASCLPPAQDMLLRRLRRGRCQCPELRAGSPNAPSAKGQSKQGITASVTQSLTWGLGKLLSVRPPPAGSPQRLAAVSQDRPRLTGSHSDLDGIQPSSRRWPGLDSGRQNHMRPDLGEGHQESCPPLHTSTRGAWRILSLNDPLPWPSEEFHFSRLRELRVPTREATSSDNLDFRIQGLTSILKKLCS